MQYSGLREASGRRYLAVQLLQEGHCWWCLDCFDNSGCDRPQVRPHLALEILDSFTDFTLSTVRRLREITEA